MVVTGPSATADCVGRARPLTPSVRNDARSDVRESRLRRGILVLGVMLAVAGSCVLVSRVSLITSARPFDFNLNWVAAHRLVAGDDLYDRAASRADVIRLVGPEMAESNHGPYSSFIGSPSVALVHAVFLVGDPDDGVAASRVAALLGMLAAIAITARVLPVGWRLGGGLVGAGALLVSWPLTTTLWIGQANELVMLAIAAAVWGVARDRWRIVGLALGVAAVLKVSPLLLVVYLVLRGRRSVLGWAAASAGTLSVMAAAVGRPLDLVTWLGDVLPDASSGSLHVGNQSVVGWLARIVSPITSLDANWGLGSIRYLGWLVVAVAGVVLFRLRRGRSIDPLELAAGLLVVLLAGPLSWDHYFVWCYVALVLLLDPARWTARSRPRGRALGRGHRRRDRAARARGAAAVAVGGAREPRGALVRHSLRGRRDAPCRGRIPPAGAGSAARRRRRRTKP